MSPSPLNTKSGVCSHSSPYMWQEFVIFAIDNHEERNDLFIWCAARQINITELEGLWEDEEETSYIVTAKDFFYDYDGPSLGTVWCQEQVCVLHLSKPEKRSRAWRDATMLYTKGGIEAIGKFKQVPAKVAQERAGWTHNPNNGGWFIVEDNETEYM